MKLNGHYNWKIQKERLVYIGRKGLWHQFEKVDRPGIVWCEALEQHLHLIEETVEDVAQQLSHQEKLQLTRTLLKSGEYKGEDIMTAWLAIDELIKANAEIEELKKDTIQLKAAWDSSFNVAMANGQLACEYRSELELLKLKPRPEFLALAESCGAVITGKPDGSEPITIVFTIDAWRKFDG